MSEPHHPINVVAKRTGLTAHVIRAWERRYRAVEPHRTATNRRVYSEADIERLSLLRIHSSAGQSISYLARLRTEELKQLGNASSPASPVEAAGAQHTRGVASATPLIERAVATIKDLDGMALQAVLNAAEIQLGIQGMLQRFVGPLAQNLGELWRAGSISAAHEHFATATLRKALDRAVRPFALTEQAPVVVVGTPAGQLHELGALLAAAQASNLGWRVIYLGTGLPASELAGAARQHAAKAVALSIVFPDDDPCLGGELLRLRDLLPPGVAIVVGGRAASAYADSLKAIGGTSVEDLAAYGEFLDQLRRSPLRGA
jgi:MerR family transcriptional regulator, light-induced transcriptional regulator